MPDEPVGARQTRVARVCSLLNAVDARYVVVGATAMQLWGSSRATRDVDILIDPTLENATRVLDALRALPFGVAGQISAADLLASGVTMIGDMPNVDVLTRAWNVRWPEASRHIAVFEVEGIPIPTLSIAAIIFAAQSSAFLRNFMGVAPVCVS